MQNFNWITLALFILGCAIGAYAAFMFGMKKTVNCEYEDGYDAGYQMGMAKDKQQKQEIYNNGMLNGQIITIRTLCELLPKDMTDMIADRLYKEADRMDEEARAAKQDKTESLH